MMALAEQVAEAYGLDFSGDRIGELAQAAQSRLHALRLPGIDSYLTMLKDPARAPVELQSLVKQLTVSETSFFRHAQQLEALLARLRQRLASSTQPVRVLSAGCASGEEPYSIAILMLERFLPSERARVELIGFDLDPLQVAQAQKGRYSHWSLRSTDPAIQQRWFARVGDGFELDPQVRRMVRFETRNLMDPDPVFWMPSAYDVIICRNVLIYFTPEAMRLAVSRFTRALAADGLLFLGHSETLRGVTSEFELKEVGDAFFYQKVGPRLEAVSARPTFAPTSTAPQPLPERRSLASLYEMLREERFLALQAVLVEETGKGFADAESAVVTAACHLGLDQVAEADALTRQALALWPRDPRFPLLLGIICERQSMPSAAITAYRTAIVVDPLLAGAHLMLGRALRRAGRAAEAAGPLREAVRLLPYEDEQRLALVSGGFARDLLMRVAAGELKAIGP